MENPNDKFEMATFAVVLMSASIAAIIILFLV
jgi:hypothetical protein